MGKVEEVAEALWQAEWTRAGSGGKRRVPWTEIAPVDQERWRLLSSAAMAAMREPTEAMKKAIRQQEITIEHYHESGRHRSFPALGSGPLQAWDDMISAALNEKEQG